MSVLIQCSKHIRTAYSLSRHRISNTLVSTSNSHISQNTFVENSNGNPYRNTNILPNRSFFSSSIQSSSTGNKVDNHIKNLDYNLRRVGRLYKRDIEQALKEILLTKTATPSQSLMLLRCCGNLIPDELPENRTKLVNKIWKAINSIGVPLDISHYNTLLKVYLENSYQYSPTEFLKNLEEQGITPNRVTFQNIITSYCQNGDIDGASRILEYMRDKQLPINHIVFNSLVLGHSQNGDMESAEGVLDVMNESKLEPSSDTYTILASGYAKTGNIQKINEIINICESKEIYLNDKDFLEIVYSLAVSGHGKEIDQILSKINKSSGYNQDAINCIYKLVIIGQEEVAFKIFDTMAKPMKADGTSPPIGRFLIGHLTKVNSSVGKVIEFCNKLVSEGTNPKAFEIAAELALRNRSIDIALGIFELLKQNEHPIRQHYFWPLFVAKNKQNDLEGLKEVLSIMISKYELSPNIDTLRFYILPPMLKKELSGTQIINDLQLLGVPVGTSTHALVLYMLSNKDISLAADIAASNRAFYSPKLIRRLLVNAFLAKNDITSLIVLLQQVCSGLSRLSLVTAPEVAKQSTDNFKASASEEQIIEMREFLSQILNDVVYNLKNSPGVVQVTQELLENMYEKGLGINAYAAEQLQNHLQGKLTFEISSLLDNLTDSNLVPKTDLNIKGSGLKFYNTNESTLENIIKKSEASGESKNGVKRQLLNLYCKNKNLEKANELKDKLIAEGFNIPAGSIVLLLDLYLNNDKLVEAKEIYQKLKSENTDFILDKYKIIKMAEVMTRVESVENAIEFLSSSKPSEDGEFTSFQHGNVCWKLLNNVAETGSIENVQKLFDLIINKNYTTVSNVLLGPLIKVQLVNNNIKGALEKFEWCCKTYRCTPWKNELASKFIEAEDATSLQALTDLSTTVHGEVNSLYDLTFTFIECNRAKQARKILETPGLKPRQDRVNAICAKYGAEGSEDSLIRLLEVTKDISVFDRSIIYNELLQLYCKNDKVQEAMALWTQMQEEDTQPSDHFMWSLSELLKKHNYEVPFTIKKPKEQIKSSAPSDVINNLLAQFDQCIKNNDVTQALALRKNIYSRNLNLSCVKESQIIELLVRENNLTEAFELTKEMLENNKPVTKKILYFLVSKLTEAGNVASLEYLNGKLSKTMINKLTLNNKIFKAYQLQGNVNELIARLETNIDESINDPSRLSEVVKNIPGGNLINILQADSSFLPTFERLHSKISKHGHSVFANSLWSYFMLNNEFDKAFNMAQQFKNVQHIQYRQLLNAIRSSNNIELGLKLVETLPIFEGINQNKNIGLVYSAIIDSYVKQNNVNEASAQLDKALEKITLKDINSTAVLKLKQSLEDQGQKFKYDTSTLKKKADTSNNSELTSDSDSSDSDNEKVAKA